MPIEPHSPFTASIDPAASVGARLMAMIQDEIGRSGGWIPFSRFMELALYAPGLGYYSAGARKVGRGLADGSDFVTAPELTPLFARALARPVADVLAEGSDKILELGGGSGALAADLLLELEVLDALPARYLMLDVSADFRERQASTLARRVPHLASRVAWIDALPERIDGIVIGNEVLDAVPVELVVHDGEHWLRRGVGIVERALAFVDRPMESALSKVIEAAVPASEVRPVPYVTEVHPATGALVASLSERLGDDSVILFIDYGFPASEYYHPQRAEGTLMAHRRHGATVDVLDVPGLQDVTAHVNFSAVAESARRAGLETIGYTSQASFLIDCGIATLLQGDAARPEVWAPQAAALQTLLSEAEMGELFKVIALARHDRRVRGFRGSDRRASL